MDQPTSIVPLADADRTAAAVLKQGGVIAFPTDTLYGIGCAFDRPRAIERVLASSANGAPSACASPIGFFANACCGPWAFRS